MYSRNTKNSTDSYEYPFPLPERYGGSRFRPAREPKTRVYTETSIPQTPSPIHQSPAAEMYIAPTLPGDEAEEFFNADTPEEAARTEPTEQAFRESDAYESAPEEIQRSDAENRSEAPPKEHTAPSELPLAGLNAEDLLLIGLILLLSREGEDNSELPALLALLLAYRGPSSENK
ncbi:MAG: hypothetical protein IJY12_05265 [Clostridia bacterium]|nr:hypothetical protein [Clostridia bacterium]